MTELCFLDMPATGLAEIPCPVGKQVRIVSVTAVIAPNEGDAFVVLFNRSSQNFVQAPTAALAASIIAASWFIGASMSVAREATVTPATGVVVYEQTVLTASAPLPDLWLPFAFTLGFNSGVTSALVVYELRPAA